ncbi:MAG: 2-phospho-L-lactate guanylyltransferase [candidate division NC10 bacterium]|nr:2-phospho-L-lactate guanylyltransferase [candidate division NC10 bacterium]
MIVALIPVKELARGKQRLKSLLTSEERHLLSKTMLEDVLSVVTRSPRFDRTLVITSDSEAAALGGQYAAGVIKEARQVRQSQSVDAAAAICRQMGAKGMLALPLDVPQVTTDDLIRIVEQGNAAPGIVLVPSRDRLGTNALLARPPDTIPFCFGYDSFRGSRLRGLRAPQPCPRHRRGRGSSLVPGSAGQDQDPRAPPSARNRLEARCQTGRLSFPSSA